jgi:hypothetical protein
VYIFYFIGFDIININNGIRYNLQYSKFFSGFVNFYKFYSRVYKQGVYKLVFLFIIYYKVAFFFDCY